VRSLFAKIFLSFFLTVLILAAILEATALRREYLRVQEVFQPLAMQAAQDAAAAYEQSGADGLNARLERLPVEATLLNTDGEALAYIRDAVKPIAAAAQSLLVSMREKPSDFTVVGAVGFAPVTSASGRRYMLIFRVPHERWSAILNTLDQYPALRLSIVALVAALSCFVLARHITRPLVGLRWAAAKMADGDLDARAGSPVADRHDEIGALGRDFNVMAGRISALVATERRLFANVSHELRSPLARLRTAVGLLRQRGETGAELDRIEREVNRLDAVVGQALTLARLESGGGHDVRARFDLTTLVQQVAADGDFEARAAGKRVEVISADSSRLTGEPEVLRSAIENVLRNAIRYTPEATSIEVSVEATPNDPAASACVRVRDHGPGVPESLLTEIFLPFRRAEANRATADGAGLGLAIADRAVRLHGGSIRAKNAPDGGLIVEITLPAGPAQGR
jgi:two-component system sensor histidine kinase CpxA